MQPRSLCESRHVILSSVVFCTTMLWLAHVSATTSANPSPTNPNRHSMGSRFPSSTNKTQIFDETIAHQTANPQTTSNSLPHSVVGRNGNRSRGGSQGRERPLRRRSNRRLPRVHVRGRSEIEPLTQV